MFLFALAAGSVPVSAAEGDPSLPLPRFASLRSEQVNLRAGPGERYPIEWILTRKDMPVEIIAEHENWRRVRDWQGTLGWVHQRMVTGKRDIIVKGGVRALHGLPDAGSPVVARAEAGVVARLVECQAAWCRIEAADVSGWVQRAEIWGVYPDEVVQ
ncbi:MAG: SH3 domain-containing protein [Alphaproteobacteria bacterium]|nr:SH3 domain-containing protein [Alphaproteobacteria bacterium]